MITRVDHIEIIVRDLKEHVTFLKKLGFELVSKTTHHGESVEMKLPGSNQVVFELHQVGAEENPGINHIAFTADDVPRTREELINNGVAFDPTPGFGETKLFKPTGRWLAHFRSPDGWRLQIASDKREVPAPDGNDM